MSHGTGNILPGLVHLVPSLYLRSKERALLANDLLSVLNRRYTKIPRPSPSLEDKCLRSFSFYIDWSIVAFIVFFFFFFSRKQPLASQGLALTREMYKILLLIVNM